MNVLLPLRVRLATLAVLLSLNTAALAETQTRAVEEFRRVEFALPGTLILEQGDEYRLVIEALPEDLEKVETDVGDETLRIRWRQGWLGVFSAAPDGEIRVHVTAPELEGLELAGSGRVAGGAWLTETFSMEISGSGSIQLDELAAEELRVEVAGSGNTRIPRVDAARVRIEISGSGDVELAGVADQQHIEVMGSGDVRASELEGAQVRVEIMGSGDVRVWATDSLVAEILGSGDVRYRGDPRVEVEQHGSGSVRALAAAAESG